MSFLLAGFFAGAIAVPLFAAEETTEGPPVFRRLFVPADAPETWPVGSERFLPIPQEEFLRLLGKNVTKSARKQLPIYVRKAVYRAKLLPDDVLRGTAEWTVELLEKRPRRLPLSPLNFAIQSAFWLPSPSQKAPSQKATIQKVSVGLWKSKENDLELAVLAEQSGTLVMQWQLAAQTADSAGVVFDLQKPIVVPQTLELDLPANHTATLSHAELLRTDIGPLGESRWVFQLAPQETHRLRIERQSTAEIAQTLPLVSQATTYQFDLSGLNVRTQLRLDARESQITELKTRLPQGLQVVEVLVDQQATAWNVVDHVGEEVGGNAGGTVVGHAGEPTLVIARPVSRQPQSVEIRCLAKSRTDSRWKLPKLRFKEVAWTEGTTSLFVSPELELRWLMPRQATLQHLDGIADRSRAGEVFRLQEWSPDAEIEIEVGRLPPRLSARTLTTIELGRDEDQASLVAILSSSGGDIFQFHAALAAGWSIDSVTTTPTSNLNEWHIDRDGSVAELHVQLNQPIPERQPLRLEIKAHKTTAESVLPATVGQLRLLHFLEAETPREWLQLRNRETKQATLAYPLDRARLERDQLPPEFRSLASEAPVGTLLDVSLLDNSEVLEFRQQAAQMEAKLQVEVDAFPESLKQHYQIDCRLRSGTVSEVVLEFDTPLPEAMQWTIVPLSGAPLLDAKQTGLVTMDRLDAGEESTLSNTASNTATYVLRFPVAMRGDFRLQASYSQPAQPLERCNLLHQIRSLDEAQSFDWHGQVLLRGSLVGLQILDQGWTPTVSSINLAAEPAAAGMVAGIANDGRLPVLGTYRIGPEELRRSRKTAGLRLQRQNTIPPAPQLVAWLVEYHTLQAADGAALHTANYSLENLGTGEATIVLPTGAQLQEAWLDNQQLELKQLTSGGKAYLFRFDRERRWPYLVLKYSTHASPLGGSVSLQPSVPNCSFPLNASRWTLLAPEQYVIDNTQLLDSSQRTHWWKRLFGPLARSRGETLFNPVSGASWTQLWSVPMEGQRTKFIAEKLAGQLVNRLEANLDQAMGEVLVDLTAENPLKKLLFVDRVALLAKGVQAHTLGKEWVAADNMDHALRLQPLPLSSYRLALLVSPGTIVLTTAERVAHWRDQLRPTETSGVFTVSSDGLVDRLEKFHGVRSPGFVEVSQWLRTSTARSPQWKSPIAMTLADVGRRAHTVEFVEGLPTLTVRRAYVQQAFWSALVLLTIVLGVWKLAHYPNVTIFAVAIAGAACLTVPAQWLTLPQAVFLGLIAAAIIRVAMKSSQFWDDSSSALRKVAQTTAFLLLCCFPHALAQAQAPSVAPREQKLPRVLVPIDSEGSLQGKDVYLSETFLKKLQHAPQQLANDGAELVLLAANYRGSLPDKFVDVANADQPRLTEPWTLRWKVESYAPNCRLFLPLQRDEAHWIEKSHRLDGVPVKLDWHPSGKGCSVVLPATGIHWLQLVVQPRFAIHDHSAEIQLRIPPLPGATLDLAIAPNVDALQVSGSSRLLSNSDRDLWRGLLGAKEVLELSWTLKVANSNEASWDKLEQSAWLHVDPAATRLDVQLKVTGYQATSLLLDIEVSPQLQLKPPGENSPIEEIIVPSPGQPSRLQLKLRSGLPANLVIPLHFEFLRASSVGRLFFPKVRLRGSPPTKNLFAVSVSTGLSYDEQASNDLRSIDPAEFSKSWNSSAEVPLYAYSLGPEDPEWSLRVWPDPQSLTAQQSLRVYCLPHLARVDFEAAIDELTGSWFSHRLQVPETLKIDTITVQDTLESKSVPVRWSRVSATEVVVFLSRPLLHAHLLQLQGHINATQENEVALPQIRLLNSERGEIHMDLYRREEVQVSWTNPQRAPQEISGQRIAHSNEEIYVGHFSWRSSLEDKLSALQLKKNHQEFNAVSVTNVERRPDGWKARLISQIFVRKGVVRRLTLTAPESFRKPYVLQPEQVGVIDQVRQTPNGNKITILLTQPATAGDQIEIQLGGNLSLPADQRLAIPSLAWDGAVQRKRYVLLPKFAEKRPLHWQTSGLRRQSLPLQLSAFAPADETARSFLLEHSQFEARERTFRGTLNNAMIRYAKVAGVLDVEGGFTAIAELLFQPGRATSCAIQLPPDSQLHQLVIGDRPARRDLREDGSWKVPIGPPFMPQRIVVSYRYQPQLSGKRLRLVPPKILLGDQALPAPQTWWSIRTTQGLQLREPVVGHLAEEIQWVNSSYKQTQNVLQDALSQALILPREEGRAWANIWQKIARQIEQNGPVAEPQENALLDLSTAEEKQGDFSETLSETLPGTLSEILSEAFAAQDSVPGNHLRPLTYPPGLPVNIEASPEHKESFYVSDSQGQLVLGVSKSIQKNLWQWFAALALVCGTLAFVLRLRRNSNWHHDLCHWPHSLAVFGGIVWWLLLEPSAIGMLVVVLALTSLTLKRWRAFRRLRQPQPSSQLAVPAS
ncbi:MAG: hypothetical protein GXP24_06670 [Planctomycetes bacterium]|nr:hypothetical protein [Planctomycetota bacterium]